MRRELKPGMVIRRRLDFGPKPKVYFVLKAGSYQARLPGTDQTRLLEHAVDTWIEGINAEGQYEYDQICSCCWEVIVSL